MNIDGMIYDQNVLLLDYSFLVCVEQFLYYVNRGVFLFGFFVNYGYLFENVIECGGRGKIVFYEIVCFDLVCKV